MNVCKGICTRFKAIGYKGRHRYENGQKRCPVCSEFLQCPDVRCPCCGVMLRVTPRANKARKEIQEKRKAVWY